ncbi:MAG: hypothetical protein C0610_16690 [Desulfobacteraceae bacterium]|nr:MAG: hypothetical protein C0610_16690 [Desulfobacteraceae bacterium]
MADSEGTLLIGQIADRALKEAAVSAVTDKLALMMDIELANQLNPIDLERWLAADDGNFFHDIYGIMQHLDRGSKQMNLFTPRYTIVL